MENYLAATYYFDFDHPSIQTFVSDTIQAAASQEERAIQLYLKVRDQWFYDAYQLNTDKSQFKASHVAQRERGHCIDKAVLLITCLRAVQIPARLHLVKVRNHIAVERIIEKFGTDELTPHAFVEIYLNDKWVAATPAFNKKLCDKLGVDTLDFDGKNDSLFQAFNQSGGKFMEYLADYGTFEDVPFDFIRQNMIAHYPGIAAFYASGESWHITE